MEKKQAENQILEIIKAYEKESDCKVNSVKITGSNHVGFSHNGDRPQKNPEASKATIKGEV